MEASRGARARERGVETTTKTTVWCGGPGDEAALKAEAQDRRLGKRGIG